MIHAGITAGIKQNVQFITKSFIFCNRVRKTDYGNFKIQICMIDCLHSCKQEAKISTEMAGCFLISFEANITARRCFKCDSRRTWTMIALDFERKTFTKINKIKVHCTTNCSP